jgi:hypothetical protein
MSQVQSDFAYGDLRFLANVKTLGKKLDKTKLDSYICPCTILARRQQSNHCAKRVAHLENLTRGAFDGDSKVLSGNRWIRRDVNGVDLHNIGVQTCIKSYISICLRQSLKKADTPQLDHSHFASVLVLPPRAVCSPKPAKAVCAAASTQSGRRVRRTMVVKGRKERRQFKSVRQSSFHPGLARLASYRDDLCYYVRFTLNMLIESLAPD